MAFALKRSFFLLTVEKRGKGGPMHLHSALGAELLTAEAAYARLAVYLSLPSLIYKDSLSRTDICANTAAYAQVLFKSGAGAQNLCGNTAEEYLYFVFTVAGKFKRAPFNHSFKI